MHLDNAAKENSVINLFVEYFLDFLLELCWLLFRNISLNYYLFTPVIANSVLKNRLYVSMHT